MKRIVIAFLLFLPAALVAQNSDIEALSGLQFNFANPGARSLGMGGAFIGLADDASAAEANPAGLTTLRKTEFSFELRQSTIAQRFVTGGAYPNVTAQDFAAHRSSITFASFVLPFESSVVAGYYHRPLSFRNQVDLAGRFATPVFYLGPNGPVSAADCGAGCTQHQIYPFSTSVDVQVETFGLAAAHKWSNFSVGGAIRYHRFTETANTLRRDIDLPAQPTFIVTQSNAGRVFGGSNDRDLTFVGGVRWTPRESLSIGAVYKKGPSFPVAVQAAPAIGAPMELVASTTFHVPSVAGVGVSYRPATQLTINADAVRIRYRKLTDNFISVMEYGTEYAGSIEQVSGYQTKDGTELHAGVEYFILTRAPIGIRAGWWRDPAHAISYDGPLMTAHAVAARILFPGTRAENHYSVGLGIALPHLGVDVAYDTSHSLRSASVSVIARQ